MGELGSPAVVELGDDVGQVVLLIFAASSRVGVVRQLTFLVIKVNGAFVDLLEAVVLQRDVVFQVRGGIPIDMKFANQELGVSCKAVQTSVVVANDMGQKVVVPVELVYLCTNFDLILIV